MKNKNLFKILSFTFSLIVIMNVSACASSKGIAEPHKTEGPLFAHNNPGSDNVKSGKPVDINKYRDLLIDINRYTTNGGYYQKKHEKHLLSMAGEIVEGQNLEISKKSVGFYFDKISANKDILFLGFDVNIEKENTSDYGKFSVNIIKENVNGIIDLMYKYNFILNESGIAGIVIGFKWKAGMNFEHVNIWMNKEDIRLFYNKKITINELFLRSITTNSSGKVILLPI